MSTMELDPSKRGNSTSSGSSSADRSAWLAVAAVYRRRFLIFGITVVAAIGAIIISLLLPKWYLASSRLLLPEGSSAGLLGMLDDLPSAAKSILGGGGGDFTRYLAILGSRTVMERVVDEFDLITIYKLGDEQHAKDKAIKELRGNVDLVVDKEYDYLSIEVLDRSPDRAAAISNFFVYELNRLNSQLASQSAGNLRRYVQQRYNEAFAVLDSVEGALQVFQEQHGVYELETQMEGFFTQIVEMRVAQLQAEALYETALSQYGPDNPQVVTLREASNAARRQYDAALAGQERLMPVPQSAIPSVARRYLELERNRLIQARILEVIAPMLEHARLDEQREIMAVQVVDHAVPPVRKEYPKRMIIVLAMTLSAFLLALFAVIVHHWWQRNHAAYASQLRHAVREEGDVMVDVRA